MRDHIRIMNRFILITTLCFSLLFTGCASKGKIVEEPKSPEREYVDNLINQDIQLNERQVEICEKVDIATEYDKLTDLQKEAIVKRDLLLNYLESKYDKEFLYENFNITDDNCFLVARALDDSYRRKITASMDWVDDEYVYSDTYEVEVIFSDQYKDLVIDYISSIKPDVPFDVKVHLNTVTDEIAVRNDVMANADGGIVILMENCVSIDQEMIDFLHMVGEFVVSKNKNDAAIDLRVYPKGLVKEEEVNVFNYQEDYILDDYEICLYHCIIENQGQIRIEGPYT